MFGLASETMDVMMRASTRRALTSADIIVNVPLKEMDPRLAACRQSDRGGLPRRRGDADQLLLLAVSQAEFETWRAARQAKRRTSCRSPPSFSSTGSAQSDATRLDVLLARHVGRR